LSRAPTDLEHSNSRPVHVLEPVFWTGPCCWTTFGQWTGASFHGSVFSADPRAPGHVTSCLRLLLCGCLWNESVLENKRLICTDFSIRIICKLTSTFNECRFDDICHSVTVQFIGSSVAPINEVALHSSSRMHRCFAADNPSTLSCIIRWAGPMA